jgi:hypothetical protein
VGTRLYLTASVVLAGCSFRSSDTPPASTTIDAPIGSMASDAPVTDIDAPMIDAIPKVYDATCAEIGESAADTDVTLYLDHDPNKPWAAHCHGSSPDTYLLLGAATNTSSYPAGGCATASQDGDNQSVMTVWTMVRFDPVTRIVTTGDYFGAKSTGSTHEVSGNGSVVTDYAHIPFATGRTCSTSQRSLAAVDLSKTKFAIAMGQPWTLDGFSPSGMPAVSGDREKVSFNIGGFPVGASPCAPNFDYYTTTGGPCLTLAYAP